MSDSTARNPLFNALGRALQAALNRALDLDPETRKRIAALEGRSVGIELRGLDVKLRAQVENARLTVGPADESDLHLCATPGSFLAMALRRGESSSLPAGKVSMSGDAELARRVEQLLSRFDPDFDEMFTELFGDVIGYQLAKIFKRFFQWSSASAKAMVQNAAEYLREESRDLVAPAEMESFLDSTDHLRERTERLEARVRRLLANFKGHAA